jgi:ribosome biogenesis GTPase
LTPDLGSLGWTDQLDQWAQSIDVNAIRGRVARVSRGYSLVFTGGAAVLAASDSTRTRTELVPATGDYVVIEDNPEDGPHIADIAPRSTALARRAPGRVPEAQVLAANIDSVFVMQGLDRPLNLRRIERQLVVSWDSGATPVVVLTKSDQIDDPAELDDIIGSVEAVSPGAATVAVSMVDGTGLDQIEALVPVGHTVALMGLSGIGKSTLVNVLSGGQVQRTGEVRATDRRGRHTTVTRDLIPLPGRGLVIDTPGIREIGLWQAYYGLDRAFPEIAEAVSQCRFANCGHDEEPGCGVRQGLAQGVVPERRLDHWRDLMAELELQDTQLEEFARRADSRDRADAERRRDKERPNTRSRKRPRRRR